MAECIFCVKKEDGRDGCKFLDEKNQNNESVLANDFICKEMILMSEELAEAISCGWACDTRCTYEQYMESYKFIKKVLSRRTK